MNVTPLQPLAGVQLTQGVAKTQPQGAVNQLGETFSKALDSLSNTQNNSDALIQKLAAGENVDLHQVMIASEQTDISFRVAMAMRDKLVEAYQQVSQMQI
jgi:flagellar hook-basal body complex protein FliE